MLCSKLNLQTEQVLAEWSCCKILLTGIHCNNQKSLILLLVQELINEHPRYFTRISKIIHLLFSALVIHQVQGDFAKEERHAKTTQDTKELSLSS